jgi:secreted PhoX family phosphatase
MKINTKWIAVLASTSAVLASCLPAQAADAPIYMEAVGPGVSLDVLATSGDTVTGYLIPGTPDGIGAYKSGSTIKLIMNHEFTAAQAVAAGRTSTLATGSTISEVTLDAASGKVSSAKELLKSILWYDYQNKTWGSTPTAPIDTPTGTLNYYGVAYGKNLDRFCSSSLANAGTFTYKANGKTIGYSGAVYFTAEESGINSRGFAMNTAGELVQLPKLGLAGQETFNAAATTNNKTVILGNEDDSVVKSELRLYVGTKNNTGAWYEKAGLTNGTSYFAKIDGMASDTEFRNTVGKGIEKNVIFNEYNTDATAVIQNSWAGTVSTGFSRIEDGAFDPKHPNDYYFVTTSSNADPKATALDPNNPDVTKRDGGGLWRLRFKDINNPLKGATVKLLLDGTEAPYLNMPDNLTIDSLGHILLQEDPGGNDHVARVAAYDVSTGKLAIVAKFADKYFGKNADAATKITNDEESSGVLDVTSLFKKSASDKTSYFVLDAQVHTTTAIAARPDLGSSAAIAAAVEGGQLYLLKIADWSKVEFK